jgi:thermostable 8-oxoguanine DNA glycosylase
MNDSELERALIFCLIDKMMPYDKVCKTLKALEKNFCVTRNGIKEKTTAEISNILKSAGYRFPNKTAQFIKEFGDSNIDLRKASREELTKIKGMGMKLASLFLRETRGEEVAVLDVHTLRWLKERNLLGKTYVESEQNFANEAKKLKVSVRDLDLAIWEAYRKK